MPNLIQLPTANKNKFEIQNKTETYAEIFLYGSIGNNPWDDTAISEKDIADELRKLPKTIKNIDLRVNSGGGSVFSGTTIYELLKAHPAKVTAYVEGMAASIASVIIMAADEIIMGEGAFIMIHKPLSALYGNANDFQKTIDILDKIENQMVNIYKKRMSVSKTEIERMLAEETWFNDEEAIKLGLADKKMEMSAEARYLAASLIEGNTWMKNKPQIKSTESMIKEKLKELTNQVNTFSNSK